MNQHPLTPKLGFKKVLGTAGDSSMVIVITNKSMGSKIAYTQYHANLLLILRLDTDEFMYLLYKKKKTILVNKLNQTLRCVACLLIVAQQSIPVEFKKPTRRKPFII